MTQSADYALTAFQAEEVEGLLAVCADNHANGDRGDEGWGTLKGRTLSVFNAKEAAEDLEWRAQYLMDEGYVAGSNGAAGARSLRSLVKQIDSSGAEFVPVLNCPGSGRESSQESSERCRYCGQEYVLTPTGRMPNHDRPPES